MVLKKELEPYTRCPLAAMKRQKPKLQLQLRRGEKKKRARCTRNYSDDNATLRMHPKRTDEASEFQKPLLTEIHCGESRSRFFIPLFFVTFSLSPPLLPPPPLGRTPMHLRRAFFKVEMHLHVCMPRANTLHARPSDEMDISGRKWRYTGKWCAVFIPVPLNRNGYLSVRPTYFQKEFVKKDGTSAAVRK